MDVLVAAAAALALCPGTGTGTEPELNLELYWCALRETSRREKEGLSQPAQLPVREAPAVVTPATATATSSRKIPDLQWTYVDQYESDPAAAIRAFVVECKRLGKPALNRAYVTQGIARFVDPHWAYGLGVSSAAMVGYVQSRPVADVLVEVNRAASAHQPAVAALMGPVGEVGLQQLAHVLTRTFPTSPFGLDHIWLA